VHDLPAGGKRLVQRVDGYEATLVAGTPVFERGAHTGATPGRLVAPREVEAPEPSSPANGAVLSAGLWHR
jgi:N-acyl-D-aspartate/D-glutamate deacylase